MKKNCVIVWLPGEASSCRWERGWQGKVSGQQPLIGCGKVMSEAGQEKGRGVGFGALRLSCAGQDGFCSPARFPVTCRKLLETDSVEISPTSEDKRAGQHSTNKWNGLGLLDDALERSFEICRQRRELLSGLFFSCLTRTIQTVHELSSHFLKRYLDCYCHHSYPCFSLLFCVASAACPRC